MVYACCCAHTRHFNSTLTALHINAQCTCAHVTKLVCPLRVRISSPSLTRQSLTVSSYEDEASIMPSGEYVYRTKEVSTMRAGEGALASSTHMVHYARSRACRGCVSIS